MTHLEMRNIDMHYDPEDAEMSAQERLLFNNNFNNNHQHIQTSGSGEEENQYQVPYAHLQQHHYLQHQQQLQHQPMPGMYSGSGGSSSDGRVGTFRPSTPRLNGHHHSPVPHHPGNNFHDKYSVAYPVREDHLGRHGNRSTGSGIVYRPRRKLWWFAAMLLLFLLLVAGAVVIAIYFTVLKKEEEPQTAVDGTAVETEQGRTPQTNEEEFVTKQPPPYNFPNLGSTTSRPRGSFVPMDTKVQKFDAYWHPGDSRLFVASLTNGTVIQVFGPKKSDGTVKSLYSLSMSGYDGMVRSVRFLGQRNLASVVLPSGVIVSYDWSANNLDMEIKVFEPYTEGTLGPISHLALVEVGVRSYLLRQISKFMTDMRSLRTPIFDPRRGSTKCFSRFPVMVTKCGGQYPYDGAFVQGEITGIETPITMAALPWPKESDPCYSQESGSVSNYYLPLPGQVDDDNATMIKDAYTASSARLFSGLCNIINDQVYQERQSLCSDLAEKVVKKLNRQRVLGIIYDSCSAILNSLHTACVAISGIAAADNMPTPLTENGLMRSLNRRLSDSFQPGLPDQVDLKAHAFCPSSLPLSSYQSTVAIHSIRGNVAQDVIHINCPDYPEVTKVDLDHLLTTSESSASHYDLVKHKMTVCSICAFEKSIHAKIVYDEMICNNTCSKNNMAEIIPDNYVREGKEFLKQDSVYCHDFLTAVDNSMEPIGRQCVANCMSHLHVKFQIRDPSSEVLYYDQTVQCSDLRSRSCKMKFGR